MPKMKCPTCESDDPFFDHYEDGSKLARDLISPAHLCPDPFHSPEADKGTERAGERWAVRAMQLEDMLRFQRERAERAEAALQEAREAVRRHEADKGAERDQWVRVSQIRFGERPDGSRNWMRVVPASQLQGVTGDYERSEARLAEVSSQLQEAREALRNCLADLEQAVAWLHPEEAGSFNLDRHRKALTDTEKPDD